MNTKKIWFDYMWGLSARINNYKLIVECNVWDFTGVTITHFDHPQIAVMYSRPILHIYITFGHSSCAHIGHTCHQALGLPNERNESQFPERNGLQFSEWNGLDYTFLLKTFLEILSLKRTKNSYSKVSIIHYW